MTFQARHVLVGHGLWLSEERSPCCGSLKKNEKSGSFGKLGIPPSPEGLKPFPKAQQCPANEVECWLFLICFLPKKCVFVKNQNDLQGRSYVEI